ncbi:DUF4397 domain-containing protein [Chitinophaga sp. XS-30]|uniref:DUF4397 domain-containing protein n=1 Tax=Chitinophaga sp. XS-30 TaxID=2604421 RepID=UPI0011DD8906|nr:DUF4397 domain-containing protein [Chitinophaga sp. XS-30]QEH43825.1 DUF4397 domain-containing protein [Chitinophaga sp. XS-30]
MKKTEKSFPSAILGLCLFFGTGLLGSCSKTPVPPGAVSLTIVNTLTTPLIVNFNEEDSILFTGGGVGQIVDRNTALAFGLNGGKQIVNLREINTANPIYTWADHSMLNLLFDLPAGTMGSLFVSGTKEVPDTLLVRDSPLHFPAGDSSMGIRFINLSGEKAAVDVNLAGQADGSEAADLAYKNITAFTRYPADASVQQYVFEFRNASDGSLLATAAMSNINNPGTSGAANLWRHRNFTLVFRGVPGSTDSPPAAFIVRNH